MNRLHALMQERNLTYQELSILIQKQRGVGISEGTLTKIIKHNYEPTMETKQAIAMALNVEPNLIWST